jgi:hypothetical protein
MPDPKSWPLRVRTASGESVPVLMRDPATGDTSPVRCSAPGLESATQPATQPVDVLERKGPDGRYGTADAVDCAGDPIIVHQRPMTGEQRRGQLSLLRKWAKELRAVGAKEHRRLDWIERIHLQGLLDSIGRLEAEEETSDYQGSSSRAAR